MNQHPTDVGDQLWRAALTVLATAVCISVAYSLLHRLIGPLVVGAVLIGIIRMAILGARRRRGW